jgi:hypothetical protein
MLFVSAKASHLGLLPQGIVVLNVPTLRLPLASLEHEHACLARRVPQVAMQEERRGKACPDEDQIE